MCPTDTQATGSVSCQYFQAPLQAQLSLLPQMVADAGVTWPGSAGCASNQIILVSVGSLYER